MVSETRHTRTTEWHQHRCTNLQHLTAPPDPMWIQPLGMGMVLLQVLGHGSSPARYDHVEPIDHVDASHQPRFIQCGISTFTEVKDLSRSSSTRICNTVKHLHYFDWMFCFSCCSESTSISASFVSAGGILSFCFNLIFWLKYTRESTSVVITQEPTSILPFPAHSLHISPCLLSSSRFLSFKDYSALGVCGLKAASQLVLLTHLVQWSSSRSGKKAQRQRHKLSHKANTVAGFFVDFTHGWACERQHAAKKNIAAWCHICACCWVSDEHIFDWKGICKEDWQQRNKSI